VPSKNYKVGLLELLGSLGCVRTVLLGRIDPDIYPNGVISSNDWRRASAAIAGWRPLSDGTFPSQDSGAGSMAVDIRRLLNTHEKTGVNC